MEQARTQSCSAGNVSKYMNVCMCVSENNNTAQVQNAVQRRTKEWGRRPVLLVAHMMLQAQHCLAAASVSAGSVSIALGFAGKLGPSM